MQQTSKIQQSGEKLLVDDSPLFGLLKKIPDKRAFLEQKDTHLIVQVFKKLPLQVIKPPTFLMAIKHKIQSGNFKYFMRALVNLEAFKP